MMSTSYHDNIWLSYIKNMQFLPHFYGFYEYLVLKIQ